MRMMRLHILSPKVLALKSRYRLLRGGTPWRHPHATPRLITFELGQRNTSLAQQSTPAT